MTAPSGLMRDLCERLDAILVEESPMHPFGCSTWEEASRIAIDMAKEVIVTAASAQARIAEEQAKAYAEQQAAIEENRLRLAAEARADRLAEVEGDLNDRAESCLSLLPSCGGAMAKARIMGKAQAYLHAAELARAALQQETQP